MPGEMQRPGLRMNLADRVAIFEQQVQMIKEFKFQELLEMRFEIFSPVGPVR